MKHALNRTAHHFENPCINGSFLPLYRFVKVSMAKHSDGSSTDQEGLRQRQKPPPRRAPAAAAHKPPRLKPGARIGVVAPAGCVDEEALRRGVAAIEAEGFEVEIAAHVFQRKGYLAGDATARADELTRFFQRGDIDAIFCARGGFGSVQLLPLLNSDLRRYPKIFVGYSDLTVLINWLRQSCGILTFHAPMVAMDLAKGLSPRSREHFWDVLTGARDHWCVHLNEVIRPGRAQAEMRGGCLSLLVTMLGTSYEIDTRGKIVFLEDVGEKPYRIERMLTHLKMAGKFDHPAGVVFGDFTHCDADGPRDVRQVIIELFHDANFPVVMGMAAGHGPENLALPIGAEMSLDGGDCSLSLDESPVV
jgi:muramoyltetrapeptide carboxypeptidase